MSSSSATVIPWFSCPFDDDDLAWYARRRDPAFLASLAKARGQVEEGESVSHEDLKKELGLD